MDSSELDYDQSNEIATGNNYIEECSEIISNSNSENMELTEEFTEMNMRTELVRSSKRNRQIDKDEIWTTISRRGKRFT